jgi:hypothetical protein
VITHSDPAASLGDLRQAYEHRLAQLSYVTSPVGMACLIGVTRTGQLTKAHTQFATAVSIQSFGRSAEMMDVYAGAIDRDTRIELADRQLHRCSQAVLTQGRHSIRSHCLHREEIRW